MLRAFLLLLFFGLLMPVHADERATTQQQIEQTQKDIAELEKLLKKTRSQRSNAEQKVKEVEQQLGEQHKKIRQIEQQLENNQSQIKQLQLDEKKLQKQREQQQDLIATQGRAAYQAGQQDPLRLFLNRQQAGHTSHNLVYYQFLHQARSKQVNNYNQTLGQLHAVQQDIHQQMAEIESQKKNLLEQQAKLASLKQERQQRVQQLARQQSDQQQRLGARQKEQQDLSQVLATIEATLARQAEEERLRQERARAITLQQQSQSTGPAQQVVASNSYRHLGGDFSKLRGKLSWPISGSIIANFNTPRGDARAKWDGVLIQAPEGTQIKAIHPGRVVFADWLRGAGLLVIIDHGSGYLTLYGHNQSLLSSAGDTIKAGQVIATVGNTGGMPQSALYFAIRQGGKATDPNQWCRT